MPDLIRTQSRCNRRCSKTISQNRTHQLEKAGVFLFGMMEILRNGGNQMLEANLYVLLALFAERNAILEKRVKDFEQLAGNLTEGYQKQEKLNELLRQSKKTYHGKPYLRKAA